MKAWFLHARNLIKGPFFQVILLLFKQRLQHIQIKGEWSNCNLIKYYKHLTFVFLYNRWILTSIQKYYRKKFKNRNFYDKFSNIGECCVSEYSTKGDIYQYFPLLHKIKELEIIREPNQKYFT